MRSHILTKLDIDPARAAADLDYKAEMLRDFMIGARQMDERFTITEWAAA